MTFRHASLPAFTLMETLLYGLTSVMILASISAIFSLVLQSRVKSQTVNEVEGVGLQLTQRITQSLRNATAISSPAVGTSGSILSITTGGQAVSFQQSGTAVTMTIAGVTTTLTPDRVKVTSLTFTNLAQTGTAGSVQAQFTVAGSSTSTKTEYSYTKTFYATASIRQ